jgi:hypothetical protein
MHSTKQRKILLDMMRSYRVTKVPYSSTSIVCLRAMADAGDQGTMLLVVAI